MLNKLQFTVTHSTPRFATVVVHIPKHMLAAGTTIDWVVFTRWGNEPVLDSLKRRHQEATASVTRLRSMGWADFEGVDVKLINVAIAALGGAL